MCPSGGVTFRTRKLTKSVFSTLWPYGNATLSIDSSGVAQKHILVQLRFTRCPIATTLPLPIDKAKQTAGRATGSPSAIAGNKRVDGTLRLIKASLTRRVSIRRMFFGFLASTS